MTTYLVRRLAQIIPVLLIISAIIFVLTMVLPGDAVIARQSESGSLSQEQKTALKDELGLDDPVPLQYARWLGNAVRGDLGSSFVTGRSVVGELKQALPVTLEMSVLALIFASVVGIPLGVVSAVWSHRPADYASRVISILGLSLPNFWLATLVIVLPAYYWGYLPPLKYARFTNDPVINLQQMLPAALVLSFFSLAVTARVTRSALLDILRDDYVRTARAKGLRGRSVVVRHALPNAASNIVVILGVQFAALMGGSVVIEQIFNMPGMGSFTLGAVNNRDYPQLQAAVTCIGLLVLLVNLAMDIVQSFVDPRLRLAR